jgi:hypothetical protein
MCRLAPPRDSFVDLRPLDGARFLVREEAIFPQGSALWKNGRSPYSGKGRALPPPVPPSPNASLHPPKAYTTD